MLVDENSLLKSQLSSLRHTMMKLEYKETDKNILVWNVTAIDAVNAKAIFDSIISSCRGIHEDLRIGDQRIFFCPNNIVLEHTHLL